MQRREVLTLLGAAALAAPAKIDIANYKPRFLTSPEYELVDALTAMLIPSDGTPGARDAGVKYYIDTVLFRGDEATQGMWRDGLASVERIASQVSGKRFADCSLAEQAETMNRFEHSVFFRPFKVLTVDAFALSTEGQRFFAYKGNTAIEEFPGCQEKA